MYVLRLLESILNQQKKNCKENYTTAINTCNLESILNVSSLLSALCALFLQKFKFLIELPFVYLLNVTYEILTENSISFFAGVKIPRYISDYILYALAWSHLYFQRRIRGKNTSLLEDFSINFYIFIL